MHYYLLRDVLWHWALIASLSLSLTPATLGPGKSECDAYYSPRQTAPVCPRPCAKRLRAMRRLTVWWRFWYSCCHWSKEISDPHDGKDQTTVRKQVVKGKGKKNFNVELPKLNGSLHRIIIKKTANDFGLLRVPVTMLSGTLTS